jgi:hypothetical protein
MLNQRHYGSTNDIKDDESVSHHGRLVVWTLRASQCRWTGDSTLRLAVHGYTIMNKKHDRWDDESVTDKMANDEI